MLLDLDLVRKLGADHVIDHEKEDFTKSDQQYDLILDVIVKRSIFQYKRVLKPKGHFVMIGGSLFRIFQILLLGWLFSLFGSKKMSLLMWKPNKEEDSIFLTDLIEAGELTPFIDRRYPLSKVPEAFQYFEEGQAKGKIVITMENTIDT